MRSGLTCVIKGTRDRRGRFFATKPTPTPTTEFVNFLANSTRRNVLFGLLYLSEGAPIGFIWLGLPTRQRALDVPVDQITWLMSLLILPWTLKFLWAPLVDLLRGSRWGFKQWILTSQTVMGLSLLPLFWLDLQTQFTTVAAWLMLHAIAAATQDIAIDALCIQESRPEERGALNGWMQCGVLVGRALMGGGSLVIEHWLGFDAVLVILIGLVMMSAWVLAFSRESSFAVRATDFRERAAGLYRELWHAIRSGGIWLGFLLALTAPAAFKSLEAIMGPFLIDRGYTEYQIGQFTSTFFIAGMIVGSLLAGQLAKRFASVKFVAFAVGVNVLAIAAVAISDELAGETRGVHLLMLLTLVSITIGWFTVSLYYWLMNLTNPRLAATQFTAFMAATNACEAWSTWLIGKVQVTYGYPTAILCLCGITTLATVILFSVLIRDA